MARSLVVDSIGLLITGDRDLGTRTDAAVVVEGDRVVAVERAGTVAADERVDAGGRAVVPGFVDSHTHLVFAGDRAEEFVARMAGQPYAAGGIRDTTDATTAATDDELRALLALRRTEARRAGITTVEIKSGYALTTTGEARLLRLANEVTDETTFLGAHAVPTEYAGRTDDYVALVAGEMLAACAPHARWCDAFCEVGAFDVDQCREVLTAGARAGLGLKLHAAQLGPSDGVRLAVELGAASVDHCTHLTAADVDALAGSGTVATLLPAADFCTRQPYPDGRALLDAGATVALATNCNPGSSNTTSMGFVLALAVRELGLTVDEALTAATAGGAAALRRTDIGRIAPGARADLVVLDAPSPTHLVYRPGVPLVATVVEGGRVHPVSRTG